MVAPLLAATLTPIIGKLFENGLTILGNAALAKGKNVIGVVAGGCHSFYLIDYDESEIVNYEEAP